MRSQITPSQEEKMYCEEREQNMVVNIKRERIKRRDRNAHLGHTWTPTHLFFPPSLDGVAVVWAIPVWPFLLPLPCSSPPSMFMPTPPTPPWQLSSRIYKHTSMVSKRSQSISTPGAGGLIIWGVLLACLVLEEK